MPTTLLDGETWDQAYARRFRDEAEIDAAIEAKALPAHKRSNYLENIYDAADDARKEQRESQP